MTPSSLVRVVRPIRHAGIVVCQDHVDQLDQIGEAETRDQPSDASADPAECMRTLVASWYFVEDVAPEGHTCLMCGVAAVSGRLCENDRCRRPLHPQWPAVYCCNDCALEDV